MRAWTIPGPVRVALGVDAGIAAIYAMATVVGAPDGRFGTALVAGEAAAWAGVLLVWVFPPFWSRWSATVEQLFLTSGDDGDGDGSGAVPLAPRPSTRSMTGGATLFSVLVVVQALTSTGAGVPFRSVVAAYVVAGAIGAAALAVATDVSSLLAATRAEK